MPATEPVLPSSGGLAKRAMALAVWVLTAFGAAVAASETAVPEVTGTPLWVPEVADSARFSDRVELYYRLTAEIASTTLDARVEAGGRLLMAREGEGRRLSLLQPLEPAWKFYRVDPLGPGGEAKMASVVTLKAGSWQELERAREAAKAEAAARWKGWRSAGLDGGQSFDGSFAFVVLGPARGRFEADLTSDGRVERVSNRLTDRWLPGPLAPLLERWQRSTQGGTLPPSGYWFWEAGAEPFAWEPHTYHAFVTALELLEAATLPVEGSTPKGAPPPSWKQAWPGFGEKLAEVLAVLTPKARGWLRPRGGNTATLQFTARPLADHRWLLAGETPPLAGGKRPRTVLQVSRRWVYDEKRQTAVADSLRATMRTSSGTVTLEVGFEPAQDAASDVSP